jgi:predicted outer membrane protein
MKTKLTSGFVLACLIGMAGAASGADLATSGDKHFFREFSQISLEVERIGQLAQTQSQNAKVKALGQELVQDYAQAGQEAAATSQALRGGETPQMSAKAVREVNKLAGLSGIAFDQAALRELFKCEESGAQQLELKISNSPNLAVRQLAAVLQTGLEPALWQTTQMDASFNGHVRL